jgi:uncharacterized protein (TIGR03067 family)
MPHVGGDMADLGKLIQRKKETTRMFKIAIGMLTFFSLATFVTLADDKASPDAATLQGTWQAIDFEANGERKPQAEIDEFQIVVQGNSLAIKPDGEGRKLTFKLDSKHTPKLIDLVPSDGGRKDTIVPGIYALENGKLKLCVNVFGKDQNLRPTEFKTHAGDGCGFVILERAAKK